MPSLREKLERLYEEHAQAVFGFALTLTGSHADADDILQEVFCRLAKRPLLLRSVEKERSLLLRMARNLAIDGSRRRQVRTSYAESCADGGIQEALFEPVDDVDAQALRDAVSAAVIQLPDEQREVLHLKIWEEMTLETIAKTLRIPAGTAASRFRYGMSKLRDLLR
ncbi:MAG: sigma-70 family RNA polymerase sigma factor, partial [Chthoniobacterales bacterium]